MGGSKIGLKQVSISPGLLGKIKTEARVVPLEELVLLLPRKKKLKTIKGILKGKTKKKATELVREERKQWR